MKPSVLDGVRVLDLSWGIAGPVAGMLLSDHGAEVIKIEPPGGDPFRRLSGYAAWLRGRRSVVLDLKTDADRERFLALVDGADVVLTSFGRGVRAELGIPAQALTARNPRLIDCSITPYGDHAGHRDRPGYDALVAARLGVQWEQRSYFGGPIGHIHDAEPFLADLEIPEGMEPGSPREGPIFSYSPWPSLGAAFLATAGISAALLARDRTGRGQTVETSLLQAVLTLTSLKWQRAENPDAPGYRTWTYDRRATKGIFQTSDGRWVQHWVPNPQFVLSSADGDTLASRRSTRALDDPDRIGSDPHNIVILAHYFPQLVDAMARFPSEDWVRVAAEAGVPLQPVQTPEEALMMDTLLEEGATVDIDHPEHGRIRQAGILYTMTETPGRVQGPAPVAGQHTDEVLAGTAPPPATPSVPAPGTGRGRPPLDGVTVLDLGFAVAGPFGTQLLSDLGANVIKVNAKRDVFWHATHIAFGCNRGKRSICIDLKHPDGLAAFYRLVEKADVVHSNMRANALARLKCDEESLRKINPNLIYCHTRGFEKGPRSDSPGNDQTAGSLAGVTWEDGGGADGGRPFWSLTSLGDSGNGFLSAIAVIQALYHRGRTGVAQAVDTSILNAHLLNASYASVLANGQGIERPRLDRMQLGTGALYRLYRTTTEWLCIAVLTQDHWASLTEALPVLQGDDRFGSAHQRTVNDKDLAEILEGAFGTGRADEWFRRLDTAGVPCEISSSTFEHELFEDEELRRLGLVVTQQHPQVGRLETFGTTIDFSDTPGRVFGPPPVVGQHSRAILAENGFGPTEIDDLLAADAVYQL
jgi:crotonobetainyl-CoA:carnitine CoA-transferase CaiB-like acyl-CoA transferase